jgi:CRP/FNR family transcriptional regulator, cyclic AMP receptor protein
VQYGEAISMLRRIPLFSKLDPSKLKLLAFSSTYLTFEAGEELFREGDPADGAYIIEEGEVDVLTGPDDRRVKVGTLGKSDLFGEMALIMNETRSATIRAAQHLKVLKIDADVFLRLVTENPEAAISVMRSLSEKISRLTERYQELQRHVSRNREG